MARGKLKRCELELFENRIGLLLERALDLAVSRPPERRKGRLKHLTKIRDAAADAATLASAAIVLLSKGLAEPHSIR